MTLRRAPLFAQALLEKLDVRGVPDVRQIASALGIEVEEADANTFDGALVRFKGSIEGAIAVRKSIREIGQKTSPSLTSWAICCCRAMTSLPSVRRMTSRIGARVRQNRNLRRTSLRVSCCCQLR